MKLPIMIAVDFPVLGGASQIRDIWPGEACCPQAGDRVDGPAQSRPQRSSWSRRVLHRRRCKTLRHQGNRGSV